MRYQKPLLILFSLLTCTAPIWSQSISFSTDGSGCGNLNVSFSIEPSSVLDTVSSISWEFDDGIRSTGVNAPTHNYESPGIYKARAIINSVTTLESAPIAVFSVPDASIAYADSISETTDYTYIFGNTGIEIDSLTYNYDWSTDDGGIGNSRYLVHTFPAPGVYRVNLFVENSQGCADSSSVVFNVSDILQVPNVFTPNMDGYNDFFRVRTNGLNIYELSVYTRSGSLVYRSESSVIQWDGRSHSGVDLRPGLYFFVIRQTDGSGNEERSGFIHLIR